MNRARPWLDETTETCDCVLHRDYRRRRDERLAKERVVTEGDKQREKIRKSL